MIKTWFVCNKTIVQLTSSLQRKITTPFQLLWLLVYLTNINICSKQNSKKKNSSARFFVKFLESIHNFSLGASIPFLSHRACVAYFSAKNQTVLLYISNVNL